MTVLAARAPRDVLIVAMANKMARIAWAVLPSGKDYRALHCLVSTRGIDIGRVRGCFVFDHKKSRIYFRHKAVGFTCLF